MDSKKDSVQSNSQPAKTPDNVAGSSAPVSTPEDSTITTSSVTDTTATVAPSESSVNATAAGTPPPTTTVSSTATPVTPKKKGKGCVIGLVVAVILLLMLCGCGFIASRYFGEAVNNGTIQETIEDKVKEEVEKGVKDGLNGVKDDIQLTSLQTYTDADLGFSFAYPENWEAKGTTIGSVDSGYTMINVNGPDTDYKIVIMAAKTGNGTQMQKLAPKGLQEVEASSNTSVTFGNDSGLTLSPVYYADGNKIKEVAFLMDGAQTFDYQGVTYLVYITGNGSNNESLDISETDALERAERIFSSVGSESSTDLSDEIEQQFNEEDIEESLRELERIFQEFENNDSNQ